MRILIVSATIAEIRPLLQRLTFTGSEGEYLQQYSFQKHSIDLLVTGIGLTHTAFHLGRQLNKQHYDLAMNVGIAGAYSRNTRIGTVYQVNAEIFGLMGIEDEENYLSLFDLGLLDPDSFPYEGGWLVNNEPPDSAILKKLPAAKGVTVNMIYTHTDTIETLKRIYQADLESMEGAAFFYACLIGKTPFVEIRSVSNYVAERDKSHWNVPLAIQNLDNTLDRLLRELAQVKINL
ncbi:MAG: futalosine hydrolase [Bacteroidetes bacterium]|nr:futalosine hydrolase [Bacteroidota bacterium]